jgi:hypothetical protein
MQLDAHTALHTADRLGHERRALADAHRLARSVHRSVTGAVSGRDPSRRARDVPTDGRRTRRRDTVPAPVCHLDWSR